MVETYHQPASTFNPLDYIEFFKLVGGDDHVCPSYDLSDNLPLPLDPYPGGYGQEAGPGARERISDLAFSSLSTLIKQKTVESPRDGSSEQAVSVFGLGERYPGVQVVCKWNQPDNNPAGNEPGIVGSMHFVAPGIKGGPDVLSYWLFDTPDGTDIEHTYQPFESWTDILLLTEPAAILSENYLYGGAGDLPPISNAEVFSAVDIVSEYAGPAAADGFAGMDMGQLGVGYAGGGMEASGAPAGDAGYSGGEGSGGDGGGED